MKVIVAQGRCSSFFASENAGGQNVGKLSLVQLSEDLFFILSANQLFLSSDLFRNYLTAYLVVCACACRY